jgi:hypothetical protein
MKKGIFALAMTLIGGYSVGQTNTTHKVKIGLKAGVNFAKIAITGKEMEDNKKDGVQNVTSFHFGAYADVPLSTSFSIQPGIILNGKGGKIRLSDAGTQLGPPTITGTVKSEVMYIEVPLNAVYRINGFYLGAGPYAAVALSGKHKSVLTSTSSGQTASEERDIKFGGNPDDDFKRSDFGINLLAGYELKNGINLGVNYGFGLSNLDPSKGTYNNQNRVASIVLGFSF